MAATVEELTISYSEGGVEKVRQLEKEVLSKGAWATIAFLYQELDPKTGDYGEPKVTLRRYKKLKGQYIPQSRFNISSAAQAGALVKLFKQWFNLEED